MYVLHCIFDEEEARSIVINVQDRNTLPLPQGWSGHVKEGWKVRRLNSKHFIQDT